MVEGDIGAELKGDKGAGKNLVNRGEAESRVDQIFKDICSENSDTLDNMITDLTADIERFADSG